jgi:hypothetical protein
MPDRFIVQNRGISELATECLRPQVVMRNLRVGALGLTPQAAESPNCAYRLGSDDLHRVTSRGRLTRNSQKSQLDETTEK